MGRSKRKWKREQQRIGLGEVFYGKGAVHVPKSKPANVYISSTEELATVMADEFKAERERNRADETIHNFTVCTLVPSKYRLVDLETGEVWMWNPTTRKYDTTNGITVVVGNRVFEHDSDKQQKDGVTDERVQDRPEASIMGPTSQPCVSAGSGKQSDLVQA